MIARPAALVLTLGRLLLESSDATAADTPAVESRKPSGTLRVAVVDPATGRPVPCTVVLTDSAGKLVTETPAFAAGFRCAGEFSRELPAGTTHVRVYRGLEYRAESRTVDLAAGETRSLTIALERFVDLRARGWYAGDSHVHMLHGERTLPVTFDFVALTAQAEDLQYLSLAQAWALDDPTPERLERELAARSRRDCVLTWNLEAPKNYYRGDAGRCLGHCWNIALRGRTAEGGDVIRQLLDASAHDYESDKPTFANFESHALVHEQGGAVFYSHPARWWTGEWGGRGGYPLRNRTRISNLAVELPLDVVAGPTFDGLDLQTTGGEAEANAQAFALWCLLLNHGYRLAGTGSSDACFDRVGGATPGAVRTYTQLAGGFSLGAVARGLAAGRNFVTTGPLLLVSLADQPPGATAPADGVPRTLKVEAWASGADDAGLSRLEVLRNGVLYEPATELPPTRHVAREWALRESTNAWYCVRALGRDPHRQRATSGAFYFRTDGSGDPAPATAVVRVRLADATTGQPLDGSVTECTYLGPVPRPGAAHACPGGAATLRVAATTRLRASAPGYAPRTLSPYLDHPPLLEFVTGLGAEDLLRWSTFERVRDLLEDVPLTFRLERLAAAPLAAP